MSILKSLTFIAAAAAVAACPALAQDAPSMSMISVIEIDPSKEKQFDDAWSEIRHIAMHNGYTYTVFAGGARNERWRVTPIKNYADVDGVYAARKAVYDAGGKKFKKALANYQDAMTNSLTFFSRNDPEMSYAPEGAAQGTFMEIDTFYFRYGADEEMKEILADYKALMTAKESPYAYQVGWDGIGSEGNSVTIISYAENPVAMAEANAATQAMLDGDEDAEAIFARFLKISTRSETIHTRFDPEASLNMPAAE